MPLPHRFLSFVSGAVALTGLLTLTGSSPAGAQSRTPGQGICSLPEDNAYGVLCVTETNNGYNVTFVDNGITGNVDFRLYVPMGQGWVGDQGPFWTDPGPQDYYHSYFFAVGYKAWASACLLSDGTLQPFPTICAGPLRG